MRCQYIKKNKKKKHPQHFHVGDPKTSTNPYISNESLMFILKPSSVGLYQHSKRLYTEQPLFFGLSLEYVLN